MVDLVASKLLVYGRRSHAMAMKTDFEKCSDRVSAMVCGDNKTSGDEEGRRSCLGTCVACHGYLAVSAALHVLASGASSFLARRLLFFGDPSAWPATKPKDLLRSLGSVARTATIAARLAQKSNQ